ncbi:MAG: 30S ribosomal protein S20 [Candidatus Omnitrophica bacterium 4484_171]|nr:MAG: 30S ribosomal protein S20 [Candidatus Omnitrophica bacterium 4484_171]
MPQRKSAKTELKKNIKRRKRNLTIKSGLKKTIKSFKKSLKGKDTESIKESVKTVYKTIDKAAAKKIIHPNNAARKKSRIAKLAHAILQEQPHT